MAPVMRDPPLCQRFQLRDGTYSMSDLKDFHEAMLEEREYERRAHEAGKADP